MSANDSTATETGRLVEVGVENEEHSVTVAVVVIVGSMMIGARDFWKRFLRKLVFKMSWVQVVACASFAIRT